MFEMKQFNSTLKDTIKSKHKMSIYDEMHQSIEKVTESNKMIDSIDLNPLPSNSNKMMISVSSVKNKSQFNKKKPFKEENIDMEEVLKNIEWNEYENKKKKMIKVYKWNDNKSVLKINDDIINLEFNIKYSEKENMQLYKTKGIHIFNGTISNDNKFDIQNFEIKIEENEGIFYKFYLFRLNII